MRSDRGKADADGEIWGEGDWATVKLDFDPVLWQGAVNYDPRRTGVFGYLLSWQGPGGVELDKDLCLQNPFTGSQQALSPAPITGKAPPPPDGSPPPGPQGAISWIQCAGVIEKFKYKGAQNGPIYISAFVSKANASKLTSKGGGFGGLTPKTTVMLSWYIIACDGSGSGWYEAAYPNGFKTVTAYIDSETGANDHGNNPKMGRLKVSIATESQSIDNDNIDVRLYQFKFQMRPDPTKMTELVFRSAASAPLVWPWGGPQATNQD